MPVQCTIVEVLRHNVYHGCFSRGGDALLDVADALLTDPSARSFIELSQAPSFRRAWSSLYQALEDGRIDRSALLHEFISLMPTRLFRSRLVLGLDTSSILRPEAHTVPDRTFVHRSGLPPDATPVGVGWQFSTLVVLPDPVSSWVYILDNRRVPSSETARSIGTAQLSEVLARLGHLRALLVLDRAYSNAPWIVSTQHLPLDQLSRARKDQVLYRPPPPRPAKPGRGRPPLDGSRFKGSDPTTHGTPDADWEGVDARDQPIQVTAWQNLHLAEARHIPITVIRVIRPRARGTKRDPRVSWFWWLGEALPPLAELPQLYGRRFGQEHGYRFLKQDLLWTAPRVRTPEQFERWTDLVSLVHNQLFLARPFVEEQRRPWERNGRPTTPRQVRRAMGQIIAHLGTPARSPQRRGKSPGRTPGATVKRAPRQPVIRKSPPKTRKKQKTVAKRDELRQ
jgi:hypothetical protein